MTKEQAIAIGKTEWWKHVPLEEAAKFQLFEPFLCMDFSAFHEGVEKLLGRPVWTHEFAFASEPGGLREQALGNVPAPTFQQILELIPEDKRVVVMITSEETS